MTLPPLPSGCHYALSPLRPAGAHIVRLHPHRIARPRSSWRIVCARIVAGAGGAGIIGVPGDPPPGGLTPRQTPAVASWPPLAWGWPPPAFILLPAPAPYLGTVPPRPKQVAEPSSALIFGAAVAWLCIAKWRRSPRTRAE
jgi:hypothetical protein